MTRVDFGESHANFVKRARTYRIFYLQGKHKLPVDRKKIAPRKRDTGSLSVPVKGSTGEDFAKERQLNKSHSFQLSVYFDIKMRLESLVY
jgi:hypothetical protein